MAPSARNREHQDIFTVLDNDYTQIICDGPCLTLQINIRHDGKVTKGRAEICDWSINALMTYAQEMFADEISKLNAPDIEIPSVAKIAQLIDEGKAIISTREYKLEWNRQYAATRTGKAMTLAATI